MNRKITLTDKKENINVLQFAAWYHIMNKLNENKYLKIPEQLPDCLTEIVLQRLNNPLQPNSLIEAILEKNVIKAEKSIQENKTCVNEKIDELTPIEIALCFKDANMIECLFDNIDMTNQMAALKIAIQNKLSVASELIDKYPDLINQSLLYCVLFVCFV